MYSRRRLKNRFNVLTLAIDDSSIGSRKWEEQTQNLNEGMNLVNVLHLKGEVVGGGYDSFECV